MDVVQRGMGAIEVATAREPDVAGIHAVLQANRDDESLFQQPIAWIRDTVHEFVVAHADDGRVIGCAQLHWDRDDLAEILSVAVHPDHQGRGIGEALVRACLQRACTGERCTVWLATTKPQYFERMGFVPISKWQLPLAVLFGKFRFVVVQPVRRWLPALVGRPTVMKWNGGARAREHHDDAW